MRFSLRALLALILCFSVLCALLFTVPDRVALLLLLVITVHAPILSVLGIVYCDGNVRAFCIGSTAGIVNTFLLNMLYSYTMVLEEITALLQGLTSTDALDDYALGKFMFACVIAMYLSGGLLGLIARSLSIRYKNKAASAGPLPKPDGHEF